MSRRKKNLRAFMHQNINPTIEEAWDAAWIGAQKHYHSKTMQELEEHIAKLQEELNLCHRIIRYGITSSAKAAYVYDIDIDEDK